MLPGTEVRVELNEAQQPIAATIVHGTSSLQVLAFAAPRHSGIWDEVRTEIAESVRTEGVTSTRSKPTSGSSCAPAFAVR